MKFLVLLQIPQVCFALAHANIGQITRFETLEMTNFSHRRGVTGWVFIWGENIAGCLPGFGRTEAYLVDGLPEFGADSENATRGLAVGTLPFGNVHTRHGHDEILH